MSLSILLPILLTALFAASFHRKNTDGFKGGESIPLNTDGFKGGESIPLSSIRKYLKDGQLNISSNLAKLLIEEFPEKNFVFSPITIYINFALFHLASTGETESEFSTALGFPPGIAASLKNHVCKELGTICKSFQQSQKSGFELSIATGLFVREGAKLKNEFKEQIARNFNAEIRTVNFSTQRATDDINQWISGKTRGLISKLYNDRFSKDVMLLYEDVLYVDAMWAHGFNEYWTNKADFTVTPGKVITVDMMHAVNKVPYYKSNTNGYTAIGLEYVEKRFITYFVLPDSANPCLAALIEKLTPGELSLMMSESLQRPRMVVYKIPRVTFSSQHDLIPHLQKLGIKSAFSAKTANFSNMFAEDVRLASFGQATNIKIVETGTVTIGSAPMKFSQCRYTSNCVDEPSITHFILDRPFLVILHDQVTNTIISYGIVRNPLRSGRC